jgi:hypothetical protein
VDVRGLPNAPSPLPDWFPKMLPPRDDATNFLNLASSFLATTSSISVSPALGSFSFSYVLFSTTGSVDEEAAGVDEGVTRDGESEKSVGERTRKSRCWSNTCSTPSTLPSRATVSANSSMRGRLNALVKLM